MKKLSKHADKQRKEQKYVHYKYRAHMYKIT